FRVRIKVRDDAANLGRIEWHVNYRIRPVELPLEFLAACRLPDHHCTRSGTLVEPSRDLIAPRRQLRLVDIAAMGDVVTGVFEYGREHAAMFVRIVDAERALLQVGAARGHGVVVIEAFLPLGPLE